MSETKPDQLLMIIDHLIKVNISNNKWDVLKSKTFLQILTYAYLHILQ